jgi:ubiquinone/menaquinone biosynthesis C-methylase UbiE
VIQSKDIEELKMASKSSWGHINRDRFNIIIKYGGKRILDIGCGRGEYVNLLNNSDRFAVGIDLLDTLIVQTKLNKNLMIGNGAYLPFKDESFDTVLLFEVLEHVTDEKSLLKEAIRVTEKKVILSVPYGPEPEVFENAGITWHHYTDPTHKRIYDEESLKKVLTDVGLNLEEIIRINPIRPLTIIMDSWHFPKRLSYLLGHISNTLPFKKKYYMTLVAIGKK